MDMLWIRGETPGLGPGVDCDLIHLRAEDPNEPRFGAHPKLAADVLRRNRIIRATELNIAVALDRAARFLEAREQACRQRSQRRLLGRHEQLEDLLSHGPVNAGVGDGALPVGKKLVLLTQAGELARPQRVFLDVVYSR